MDSIRTLQAIGEAAAKIERLEAALTASESLKRGYLDQNERLRAWAKDEQRKREKAEEDRMEARSETERMRALLLEAAAQLRQSEYPFDWGVAAKCEKAASTYEQSGDGNASA